MDYQEQNLDELGFLGRGKSKHRPRNDPALFGGDYPFIQTGDVKAANLHVREYSETYNETGLAQSKLWDKGTLLITIAANIAETAVLDIKTCFPDSVVGFIPDESKVNAYFIKYYIDFIKREMQNISHGTTQDNLSLDKLRLFKFKIPPKTKVDEITDILLSYDRLIENNNRRIAILEEMAQSLYREWFVKFRFPGHENAKFIDSPLGKIPEGWDAVLFKDVFRTTLGGDWGKDTPDEKNNCEVSVVRGTDFEPLRVGCFSDVPKRYIPEGSLVKRRLEPGDVIVENSVNAKSRCVGRTLLVTKGLLNRIGGDVIAASFCKVFKPMDVAYGHLVHLCMKELWLNGRMSFFNNVAANGIGNFQSKRFLDTEYFLVPAERDKEIIVDTLRACTDSIYADKNNNLAATRDMLLPKLISGKFRIN